jgi:hypothetical protein
MTLSLVTGRLRERGTSFAVIGAAAMAARGVVRSTADFDLFTLDRACLAPSYWANLGDEAIGVDIRLGEAEDPLAGAIRFGAAGQFPVDLVVGKSTWQVRILNAATESDIAGLCLPVADHVGLILLKLYAGGPQDAWDVAQLLDAGDRDAVVAEVEQGLDALPPECRALWDRIRS